MMEYKGYVGHVIFDDAADIFHREVVDTRDLITFQGKTREEQRQAFHESIDRYLEWCQERNKTPDKPFPGKLVGRIPTALQHSIFLFAKQEGKSLNRWREDYFASSLPTTDESLIRYH